MSRSYKRTLILKTKSAVKRYMRRLANKWAPRVDMWEIIDYSFF